MRIPDLLKRKLLLASVIFVAVMPILASALFITYRSFQQAKLDAVDRAKSLLSHISEKQDELIAQTLQSMRILVLLPEVRSAGNACPAFMSRFITSNPLYDNAGVVRPNGDIVCSGLAHKGKVNVSEREWFRLIVKTRSPQIGGLQFGKISGKPGIIAAMPIIGAGGELTSVLYLSISVEWLEDVFAEYTLPEKSVITALDTKGVVLFQHPLKLDNEPSLMGKPYPNEKIWQHIKNAGETIAPARVHEAGKKHVYTFQRIESEDRAAMYISLRFLESAIYRDAYHNAITLILGLCLSLIATFLLAYVAGNYIFLRPVEEEIEKLNDVAETDPLTQILNRRGFERELRRAIAYVKRYSVSAARVYLDVDRLKPVNDTFGHAAGDAYLVAMAQALARSVRQSDTLARLGGDEFVILLWNINEHDAQIKAAALEDEVDALAISFEGQTIHAGISAGITVLGPLDEVGDVLTRADKAMYQRKRARKTLRKI